MTSREIGPDSEALSVLTRFATAAVRAPLVAIRSYDRQGIVRVWNGDSAELYGISRHQAVGKKLTDLLSYRDREEELSATAKQIWDGALPAASTDWQISTSGGRNLRVCSTMLPVIDDGEVQQIFCLDVDITERNPDEQALFSSGANFRALFENSADAIMLLDENRCIDVNPAALALFGYTDRSAMLNLTMADLSPPFQHDGTPSADKAEECYRLALKNGNHRFEWQHVNNRGQTFWTEKLLTATVQNGDRTMYAVTRNISLRKAAEQSLRMAAEVFENCREGILITDQEQRIISVNKAFTGITGFTADDTMGKTPQMLSSGINDQPFYKQRWEEILANDHWEGEILDRRRNGETYFAWQSITAVRDNDNKISHYFSMLSDITERKEAEARTRFLAEHDFLTSLPSRHLLNGRLAQAMATARRQGSQLAILFVDLDRFKRINDLLGHDTGDKLLQMVAERLTGNVRKIDTVSRLGGDEFVIMLADIDSASRVAHITDNLLKAITAPYEINGHELSVTASIGISIFPDDGGDIERLIKNADMAMYHAKENGRNSYQFFSTEMNLRNMERTNLENGLKQAIERHEFVLQYQPELDVNSGRTVGAEALIRWQHPELGLLQPDQFIALSEECGLIVPIGNWVLRTACLQAKAWFDQGHPMIVSVNLSVAQFRQKNLLKSIVEALESAGIGPQYLELEITESILMDGAASRAIETLTELRRLGISLAIDDFGTGYSSLSYLKRIAIDKLKIDRSFLLDISRSGHDSAIVLAIIAMAKSLNLRVIAEGVETVEQLRFLQTHGCDEYQGFYSSRALMPEELLKFRARN